MASTRVGDIVAADHVQPCCYLFRCFCCWRRLCAPNIPRVFPGRDYACVPAAGADDDRPAWSVLLGCTNSRDATHDLRLHRFRVTGSGRVLGRSDDLLERFRSVSPRVDGERTAVCTDVAEAALAPCRRRLHIICGHWPAATGTTRPSSAQEVRDQQLPPKVFSLDVADHNKSLSPLPHLPFTRGPYKAVSAHGGLWVPTIRRERVKWRLLVYRLAGDDDCGSWAEVANLEFPHDHTIENTHNLDSVLLHGENEPSYEGPLLQGYAVIRDRFILLSLRNSSFFCFDCAAGTLARVATDADGNAEQTRHRYVPILGKAVQGGDDDIVYFVRGTRLLSYKYSPGKPLAPTVAVDTIWPYDYKEGDGFLVHLGGRMLCAVWSNMRPQPCGCAARHALITTLSVRGAADEETGCFVPNGVEILHSTFRRIDMLRSEPEEYPTCADTFCFLQEYPDRVVEFDPAQPSLMGALNFPQPETYPESFDCCREFLNKESQHVPGVILLKDCKMATKSDFYFICQVRQLSVLYQISISGGRLVACREKAIEAVLCLDTIRPGDVGIMDDPPACFFVHHGSTLDVIPSYPHCDHYVIDVVNKSYKLHNSKRSKLFFSAVFRGGQHVVALCDTLQDVYILNRNKFQWRRQKTSSSSIDLSRKVNISGFVDLLDDAFVISDANTADCFLFDLKKGEWFAVKPTMVWQYGYDCCAETGLLRGRCIFVEGFIYTYSDDCLIVAYELIHEGTWYCLRPPIQLDLPWKKIGGDRRFISFDSICEGKIRDSISLCFVSGWAMAAPFTSRHTLAATIVQVMLKDTARGTKRPVRADHVDVSLSSIDQEGMILTDYAFAL